MRIKGEERGVLQKTHKETKDRESKKGIKLVL